MRNLADDVPLYPTISLNNDADRNFSQSIDEHNCDANGVQSLDGPEELYGFVSNADAMDVLEDPHEEDNSPCEVDLAPSARRDGWYGDAPFIGGFFNYADTLVPAANEVMYECNEDHSRQMWNGRMFEDREAFRKALHIFAMLNNFELKHQKTNNFAVTAKCRDVDCPWRIHASIVGKGPEFQVRTYNQNHCCSKPMMGSAHRQATVEMIADHIKETVRANPDFRPRDIITDFQKAYGSKITYRKAYLAKERALKEIRGSFEESFNQLNDYLIELFRTNPGTRAFIDKNLDGTFKGFFWSIGASIESFQKTLRPIIASDGAHLQGKYPSVLFVAITQDGDHRFFPIAFGIGEIEEYELWTWFLGLLHEALGSCISNMTFVSDRQKGLVQAINDLFPNAVHCYCCRHISQNRKKKFNDDNIIVKFWHAAKAYRPFEFDKHMNIIKNISHDAFDYIERIGRHHWANAFVEGHRYDMLTTNIAECTNSFLKDIKELPITRQVEAIRAKLMYFYESRRERGLKFTTRLTPWAEKFLQKEFEESQQLQCHPAGLMKFQVVSPFHSDVVNLDARTCTCRRWGILGIPCSHALASINCRNLYPYEFCEHWSFAETYRQTYNNIVHPTRDIHQWEYQDTLHMLPPHFKRKSGRPKKMRIESQVPTGLKRQFTCSNCKGKGHNRQRCPNPLAR